jgi:hypothetical protein
VVPGFPRHSARECPDRMRASRKRSRERCAGHDLVQSAQEWTIPETQGRYQGTACARCFATQLLHSLPSFSLRTVLCQPPTPSPLLQSKQVLSEKITTANNKVQKNKSAYNIILEYVEASTGDALKHDGTNLAYIQQTTINVNAEKTVEDVLKLSTQYAIDQHANAVITLDTMERAAEEMVLVLAELLSCLAYHEGRSKRARVEVVVLEHALHGAEQTLVDYTNTYTHQHDKKALLIYFQRRLANEECEEGNVRAQVKEAYSKLCTGRWTTNKALNLQLKNGLVLIEAALDSDLTAEASKQRAQVKAAFERKEKVLSTYPCTPPPTHFLLLLLPAIHSFVFVTPSSTCPLSFSGAVAHFMWIPPQSAVVWHCWPCSRVQKSEKTMTVKMKSAKGRSLMRHARTKNAAEAMQ